MEFKNNPGNVNQFSKPYIGQVVPIETEKPEFFNIQFGLRACFIQIQMFLELNYSTVEALCLRWVVCNQKTLEDYLKYLKDNYGLLPQDIINISDITKQTLFIKGSIGFQGNGSFEDDDYQLGRDILNLSNWI